MGKKNVTLTIDEDIWDRSERALLDIGLSRSAFVQIILEGVISSDEKTLTEQIKGTAHKLIDKVKLKM
jgi:antitoxin component of RelBE/YafQ-DinJ toxin-antitoxin module